MNSTRAAPNRIKRSAIPRYRQKEGGGTIKKKHTHTHKKGKIKGGKKGTKGKKWKTMVWEEVDNDYRVGAMEERIGRGDTHEGARSKDERTRENCPRMGRIRREENRMARGRMRGRRWAFRGPAMITGSANL